MIDIDPRVTTALIGLVGGWITAGVPAIWQYRRQRRLKEDGILKPARRELDNSERLQDAIKVLLDERRSNSRPTDLNPWLLRNLPAYLEGVATEWDFEALSIQAAYKRIGAEVILCAESKWLWEGEVPRERDIYWRLFNKFAKAMQDERIRRKEVLLPDSKHPNHPLQLTRPGMSPAVSS
jgi:hypothetical protein